MKKILAILLTGVIIAGIGFAVGIGINYILSKIKFQSPDEIATKFEKSAEEVLGEDFNLVSKTVIYATITYTSKGKGEGNNDIYYQVLKTTYYDADDHSVTGLNTDALGILFTVSSMDSCDDMMIQDWPGALYKKDDKAYLCWTYSPEFTCVLEYNPSKITDSEIIKMAESAKIIE